MVARTSGNIWITIGGIVLALLLVGGVAYMAYPESEFWGALALNGEEEREEDTEDEDGTVCEEEEEDEDEEEEPVKQTLPFTTLAHSLTGGQETRAMIAIASEAQLDAAMEAMSSPIDLNIDFANYMAIAVFAGSQATGGHDISVTHIEEDAGMLTVTVTKTDPGSTCGVTQALTSPYHIVLVRTQQADVSFKMEYKVTEC